MIRCSLIGVALLVLASLGWSLAAEPAAAALAYQFAGQHGFAAHSGLAQAAPAQGVRFVSNQSHRLSPACPRCPREGADTSCVASGCASALLLTTVAQLLLPASRIASVRPHLDTMRRYAMPPPDPPPPKP